MCTAADRLSALATRFAKSEIATTRLRIALGQRVGRFTLAVLRVLADTFDNPNMRCMSLHVLRRCIHARSIRFLTYFSPGIRHTPKPQLYKSQPPPCRMCMWPCCGMHGLTSHAGVAPLSTRTYRTHNYPQLVLPRVKARMSMRTSVRLLMDEADFDVSLSSHQRPAA